MFFYNLIFKKSTNKHECLFMLKKIRENLENAANCYKQGCQLFKIGLSTFKTHLINILLYKRRHRIKTCLFKKLIFIKK